MNDYGFDYMNYITNIPSNMMNMDNSNNYLNQMKKMNDVNKMNSNNYFEQMNKMFKKKDSDQILEPYEGLVRGNIFGNLYEPYKNYKPEELEPDNEREALLYQLMQYKFALIELSLYLDTNPYESDMIKIYNQYLDIEKQMCDKYESLYGPLTLDSNYLEKNGWTWLKSPWPWEVM